VLLLPTTPRGGIGDAFPQLIGPYASVQLTASPVPLLDSRRNLRPRGYVDFRIVMGVICTRSGIPSKGGPHLSLMASWGPLRGAGSACSHPGANRDMQPDISCQMKNAEDGSLTGGGLRKSSFTSPRRTTICSSVHPGGSAFSVTLPRRENAAGLGVGPLDLRERLTQNQLATAREGLHARTTQSAGLGEKFTSDGTPRVSPCEATHVKG
jgi:hypothetical protein